MRPGWQQSIIEWVAPEKVVGIVVAPRFPDEELLKHTLREGIDRLGSRVVWVVRCSKLTQAGIPASNDAVRHALDVFAEYEIEPIISLPNKYWGDQAGDWADAELTTTCERIIVFDNGSDASAYFTDAPHTVAKIMSVRS